MSSALLQSPSHLSPSLALHLSQQAPVILRNSTSWSASLLPEWLYTSESPESWKILEHLMLACLRTGDDESARLCLQKLLDRFGGSNEYVMSLEGIYKEATARDNAALEVVLKGYGAIIKEDPTNMPIAKRRIALLRSVGRPVDAISALVQLLDSSPTDGEAWSELSDLYVSQGQHAQAIFCLEEVLLIVPNAWNMHARMGELYYASSTVKDGESEGRSRKGLVEAMRRFCRSIELCEDYLRGLYGLKLTTGELLAAEYESRELTDFFKAVDEKEIPLPSRQTVQDLNERATARLSSIVRRASAGERGFSGYDQAEIIAARELLDRDNQRGEAS
ncbi:MAG: hypothetical protein M1817_001567 [Caeruleum heppii]|nr:MAG: hypothetical protein M1817_001567 [Caeruleum heppii]